MKKIIILLILFLFVGHVAEAQFGFGRPLRAPSGTTVPATCVVGDEFWDTDSDTDGALFVCKGGNAFKAASPGTASTECSTSSCDLHVDTTLNTQGICLEDGTDCPAAGAGDLLADGTVPLTAGWDVGAFIITALSFASDVATGTPPLVVASVTEVANLRSATASALAANGGNCGAGSYPLGVDAAGAVENCTDATTEINSAIATHLAVVADTDTTGHLNDTDWDTFNNKEPALTTFAALSTALSNQATIMHNFVITNGDTAIDASITDPVVCTSRIPNNKKITAWYFDCDKSGSIVLDVWKNTWNDTPLVNGDSIAGTEKPTLSADVSASDTSLTSMTTDWDAGDQVCIEIESSATVTKCTLSFYGYND